MPSTTSSVLDAEVLGELRHRRRAAELLGQLVGRPAQPQVGLLGRPGHAHRPRVVAEVALDLALDRAPGERRERHVAVGLEAVDGLDEGEEGDLAEVVVARAAPSEAPGDVGGEAHVPLDELVAQAPAARAPELAEQRVLVVALVPGDLGAPAGCGGQLLTQRRRLGQRERRAVELVVVGDGLDDPRASARRPRSARRRAVERCRAP